MINFRIFLIAIIGMTILGCSSDDEAGLTYPQNYTFNTIENQLSQAFVIENDTYLEVSLTSTWQAADSFLNTTLNLPNFIFPIVEVELLNETDIRLEIDQSASPGSDPNMMGTYTLNDGELLVNYDNSDIEFEYLENEGKINYCVFSSLYSKFDTNSNTTEVGPSNIEDCIYEDQTTALDNIKTENDLVNGDTILIKTSKVVFIEEL